MHLFDSMDSVAFFFVPHNIHSHIYRVSFVRCTFQHDVLHHLLHHTTPHPLVFQNQNNSSQESVCDRVDRCSYGSVCVCLCVCESHLAGIVCMLLVFSYLYSKYLNNLWFNYQLSIRSSLLLNYVFTLRFPFILCGKRILEYSRVLGLGLDIFDTTDIDNMPLSCASLQCGTTRVFVCECECVSALWYSDHIEDGTSCL